MSKGYRVKSRVEKKREGRECVKTGWSQTRVQRSVRISVWALSSGSEPGATVPLKVYLAVPGDVFDCPGWRVGWGEGAPGIQQLLNILQGVEQPPPPPNNYLVQHVPVAVEKLWHRDSGF